MSIVSPADERVGDRVESARLVCARALEEVTRVLVQKRWQDGAADHDVGKAVGSDSAIALAVTLQTLRVVGSVPGLVDTGKNTYPDDGNRIGAGLKCELELQLRCQRRSVVIIDDVEIGEDAKNPLLLLDPDLLDGDLFGGIIHRYRGHHLCDVEFAARQDYVLAWINDDGRRGPGCKSVRGDADAISSWFETFEFKESVVVRHHRAWISGDGTLKNDGGASNGVVVPWITLRGNLGRLYSRQSAVFTGYAIGSCARPPFAHSLPAPE